MADRIIARIIARNHAVEIARHYGIRSGINRHGSIVISESDAAELRRLVRADRRIDAGEVQETLAGVPVVTAPDWTMDPRSVALARLYVLVVCRPLKPVLRWLTRILTTNRHHRHQRRH